MRMRRKEEKTADSCHTVDGSMAGRTKRMRRKRRLRKKDAVREEGTETMILHSDNSCSLSVRHPARGPDAGDEDEAGECIPSGIHAEKIPCYLS
jgi:hypothetical protein